MSSIPPPLRPEPPPPPGDEPPSSSDTLYLPFLLADGPRLQLEFLSRHSSLPQSHRHAIREWLNSYNVRLAKWIHDNYGPEALRAADQLSRHAAGKMNEKLKEFRDQAERDLFAHLEKEMGLNDDQ